MGFIITLITIQINREIQKQNMYKSEIKGVVWDIFLKRGGKTITVIIETIKETILWMNTFSMINLQIL